MTGSRVSDIAALAADRAGAVPGVTGLDAGPFGTRATYGPQGRVNGLTVQAREAVTEVVVHAVVRYGEAIPAVGERVVKEVTDAISAAFPDRRFAVACHVTDIVSPEADERSVTGGIER